MASPLISYCGLYCGACSFQVAYETKDRKHLKSMPSCYDEYKDMELENCPGCRLENQCGECKIKNCAVQKGVDYCNRCDSYPCDLILAFSHDGKEHHHEILENFVKLSEFGEVEWLQQMNLKYHCKSCNTRYSWYMKSCKCEKE